jgi:hypothetical protein
MSDPIKAALILGGAIIVAVGLWIYFSPYQSCLRNAMARGRDDLIVFCNRR